ncbi:hypothetical protein GCM10007858_34530 [Bradyrhizobium liaoningense]|nr:hypothetical protein GCM10007858_34530 [Bradyrhizobium liaoningense]
MMHKAIEDRRAHSVVPKVCPPILHDAIGGDDDAAAQFVTLMDRAGPGCLDSAPLDLSGFLPGYAERGASSATVMRPSP